MKTWREEQDAQSLAAIKLLEESIEALKRDPNIGPENFETLAAAPRAEIRKIKAVMKMRNFPFVYGVTNPTTSSYYKTPLANLRDASWFTEGEPPLPMRFQMHRNVVLLSVAELDKFIVAHATTVHHGQRYTEEPKMIEGENQTPEAAKEAYDRYQRSGTLGGVYSSLQERPRAMKRPNACTLLEQAVVGLAKAVLRAANEEARKAYITIAMDRAIYGIRYHAWPEQQARKARYEARKANKMWRALHELLFRIRLEAR